MGVDADSAGGSSLVRDRQDQDLIVIGFTGVQAFIGESRRTGDLHAASQIVAELVRVAVGALNADERVSVVYPVLPSEYPPNRIVAFAPADTGGAAAKAACEAVEDRWRGWHVELFRDSASGSPDQSPGFPSVQWVRMPPGAPYEQRWLQAHVVLRARRRVRDFEKQEWPQRRLCDLSPRWPSVDRPKRILVYDDDTLSTANWLKRGWRRLEGVNESPRFPSTASIASAPQRRLILDRLADSDVRAAVDELRSACDVLDVAPEEPVPGLRGDDDLSRWLVRYGGPWVFPTAWDADRLRREHNVSDTAAARRGHEAAAALAKLVGSPASYLAVIVQDIDDLGQYLAGRDGRLTVSPATHQDVSKRLAALGKKQYEVVRHNDLHGVPVYAGGDDLLAFAPAATALRVAADLQRANDRELPASSAVVFVHRMGSLRRALSTARELLERAKTGLSTQHGLAVGFLRRSGTTHHSVQPWQAAASGDGPSATDLFGVFLAGAGRPAGLSPRLVADLERDRTELAGLQREHRTVYRAELTRLVQRHGGTADDARALIDLGLNEVAEGRSRIPVSASHVAVFLRQECRQEDSQRDRQEGRPANV